jgi:hypothetical protein
MSNCYSEPKAAGGLSPVGHNTSVVHLNAPWAQFTVPSSRSSAQTGESEPSSSATSWKLIRLGDEAGAI